VINYLRKISKENKFLKNMTNKNIDKLPETYTVSYFNENEWNKNLTQQEIEQRERLAELIYWDELLNDVKVGPGNSSSQMSHDEKRVEALQRVGSALLTISYFTPAAAFTVPLTISSGIVGVTTEIIGHAIDDDGLKSVGGAFRGIALDAAVDGITTGGLKAGKTVRDVAKVYSTASAAYDSTRGFPSSSPWDN